MLDLESVYRETLARCAPEVLVREVIREDMPRDIVAIGKCAGALIDGAAGILPIRRALAAVPAGYRMPQTIAGLQSVVGGHPDYTAASFEAGQRLLEFVDACDEVLFLISGGGSACVEVPLPRFTRDELTAVNARLVGSGTPIGEINIVRKHLSAIKGGRLAARVRRSTTLIYSDVSTGRLADVASAPTIADDTTPLDAARILEAIGGCDSIVTRLRQEREVDLPRRASSAEVRLIADNSKLTKAAAAVLRERGIAAREWDGQIEDDVEAAAQALLEVVSQMDRDEVLVAGGEPTVERRGSGRGGRCSELAVRFARCAAASRVHDVTALFASSDGIDGSSGVAGMILDAVPHDLDSGWLEADLQDSNSLPAAVRIGRAIMIPPAGNNLRDLFLLARS